VVDRLPHVAALHADSGYSATVSGTPCRLLQTLSNPWPQQAGAPQPRRPWLCPHPMPKQSFAGNLTAGQTVTSRSPKRLQCSPAKSVAILSSFVIDKNIPYYMCSHALVRVTCLFWFKRNETFSSNVVERLEGNGTSGIQDIQHATRKFCILLYTDYTRTTAMHSIILKVMAFIASGVCTTQARRSLARTTGAHRPRGTGRTSWTRPPAEFSTRRWVKTPVSKIVSREQSLVSRERPNLFAAAGAVMVLVPEAVHRRA